MTLIQQLLEITPATYEKMVINHYHQWCLSHSWDEIDCQKLLANTALFNWWYSQYKDLEFKFSKRAIDSFGKVSAKVMREYHIDHVIKMENFYSRTLMKAARKQEPVTPQLN